ncbi:glucan 1,3-beta-glucosidase precursor [Byssothecium circinans]|uniref:Glucan 1,3-beta-glucosidase n=1 Tax=Byssothecium circinans TaxID=147558 RepID=A0A6A5TF06_9PLEO|nr:glucan 1,3-beta-glucosidase precursor [Byssothecium circinans]
MSNSKLEQRRVAFDWAKTKVRGVNIGGWLVLESFLVPSIFTKHSTPELTIGDEWALCTKLGKQGCYDALKPHWDKFVKLADFKKIKKAGFNVVRIPIGYWAYLDDGAPYTSGAAPYLDKAIGWARETGLKVIIDLHAAPKSQNGFDHSGHKAAWPGWGDGESIWQTHKVLKILEDKYAVPKNQDVVIAIELLNEPTLNTLDLNTVKQFYRDGYYNLRLISETPMMMHDGFWDPAWLNEFLTPSDNNAQLVVVDHHEYQIFDSSLVGMSTTDHRTLTCNSIDLYDHSDKWLIVGEWSGAMTDCAPHINGFNSGNRYEGSWFGSSWIGSCKGKSGKVKDWSQEWKDDVRKYIETQLDAFEAKSNGWVFWNFKTEGSAGEWDLFQLLDAGVFPQPLDNRKFGKYCTNF